MFNSSLLTLVLALIFFYSRPIDPANNFYEFQIKYACLVQKLLLLSPILIKIGLNVVAVQLVLRSLNQVFMTRMALKYQDLKNHVHTERVSAATIIKRLVLAAFVGLLAYLAPVVDIKHVMSLNSYNHFNPQFSLEYREYMKGVYAPLLQWFFN